MMFWSYVLWVGTCLVTSSAWKHISVAGIKLQAADGLEFLVTNSCIVKPAITHLYRQ